MSPRHILAIVLHPPHLKRTCLVALVVGVWLSLFNVGGQLLSGPWNLLLAIKVGLNFLTPLVVANLGLICRQAKSELDEPK
ncbi:MAG: hypothetical protein EPN38_03540 [Rhodanobacteraceae bacterium]|nr:MAG: hypothetical protein EPN38_03540 [Rhodanobacteraceae bacterium]